MIEIMQYTYQNYFLIDDITKLYMYSDEAMRNLRYEFSYCFFV